MNTNKLRQIIRESIHDFIKEIDGAGDTAALDAKIAKCEEAIALREKKVEMSESLEEMKDLVDSSKINELKKEIKDLQKAKAKFEKAKEKKANKGKKKEIVTDGENPEENMEMEAKINDEELSEAPLNESFIRMQKLAGLIIEVEGDPDDYFGYNEPIDPNEYAEDSLTFGDVKRGETYVVSSEFGKFKNLDKIEATYVERTPDEVRITFKNIETGMEDAVIGEPNEPINLFK